MSRIYLEIAFDGTSYSGWQSQAHRRGIQDLLESRLATLYNGESPRLFASSRTDAGVHALALPIHFDPPKTPPIPPEGIQRALNRLLPPEVRVHTARDVAPPFHTRFSAIGKTYTYVLNCGEPTPFSSRYSWHAKRILYPEAMAEALQKLVGTHSFQGLCCKGSTPVSDYTRTLYAAEMHKYGNFILITISGDGFLYKMVRSIVGAVHDVGTGLYQPEIIDEFLNTPRRTAAAQTAPAHGLFLVKVYYTAPDWRQTPLKTPPFFT